MLGTHCGIDFHVDFDGSFWQSYTEPRRRFSGLFVKGSMTLLTEEIAEFRFETGHGEDAIYFVRNESPKPAHLCL